MEWKQIRRGWYYREELNWILDKAEEEYNEMESGGGGELDVLNHDLEIEWVIRKIEAGWLLWVTLQSSLNICKARSLIIKP